MTIKSKHRKPHRKGRPSHENAPGGAQEPRPHFGRNTDRVPAEGGERANSTNHHRRKGDGPTTPSRNKNDAYQGTPKPNVSRVKGKTQPDPRHHGRGPRRDQEAPVPDDHDTHHLVNPSSEMRQAMEKTKAALAEWQLASSTLKNRPPRPARLPYDELDSWQAKAFQALMDGESVVVDAPTTAGKTRVVEAFFAKNVNNPNFRAAYTTPVKSLSNDKLREFRAMFGTDQVGIATGDIKENLNAPIVVATLESYRNSLLGVEPDLGRRIVVFDEYHYLQDTSRGSAWEEAIILTPPSCQILLLSASVANAQEFCDWLASLRERTCLHVKAEGRPVPLVDLIYYGGQWFLKDALPRSTFERLNRRTLEMPPKAEDLVARLPSVLELGLTPCILYAGRRVACETLAFTISRSLQPLAAEQAAAIGAALQQCQTEMRSLSFISSDLRRMLQVYGVGFHHSGLAPPARMAIERLVKLGLLRFCVATMGLSLGINFAVKSALITDYSRPGDLGFTDYSASEVLQMLGRAGRRGHDVVGYSLWPSIEAYTRLGGVTREPCESRLRNDPTTFLGLVGRGFNLSAIESFYAKSFRRFRDKKMDYSLIGKKDVENRLSVQDIPCQSPPAEVALFWAEDRKALCFECPHRTPCHKYIEKRATGSLAHLHIHLHAIGALGADETLTPYGSLARFFPQAGGLLIAKMIAQGSINPTNLLKTAQLMGALSLARFKEPGCPERYRFPFNGAEIESELTQLYPVELFEEVYDRGGRSKARREEAESGGIYRDFNPAAGFVIGEWLRGITWKELSDQVATDYFGPGDMMALIYRVATYLQSIHQTGQGELAQAAGGLRDVILREPLSFSVTV